MLRGLRLNPKQSLSAAAGLEASQVTTGHNGRVRGANKRWRARQAIRICAKCQHARRDETTDERPHAV
jgi:hypothetical protein